MSFSSTLCLMLLSCLVASSWAEPDPQQYHFAYPSYYPASQPSYFRSGYPYPSMVDAVDSPAENRFFFATVTLTLSTITTTSTARVTTTCTTSTAALVTCSAGRRRRGLLLSGNKAARGLFYDDNHETEEGSPFLPETVQQSPVEAKVEEQSRTARQTPMVPIYIQPGFNAPDNVRNGRLLLAFATSTVTAVTTSTSTSVLVAVCSSTTSYSTCPAATGK